MSQSVYIIGEPQGPVKIGVSGSVYARLASLQTASSRPITLLFASQSIARAAEIEAAAHEALKGPRLAGEWFDVTPQVARTAIDEAARALGIELVEAPPRQPKGALRKPPEELRSESFPLRVSPETREALRALADADRRSLSDYCLMVLRKHVEETTPKA